MVEGVLVALDVGTSKVCALIGEIGPDVVYTHHAGDLNVDHRVTSLAVLTATRPLPASIVREVYAFEVPSSTEWAFGQAGSGRRSGQRVAGAQERLRGHRVHDRRQGAVPGALLGRDPRVPAPALRRHSPPARPETPDRDSSAGRSRSARASPGRPAAKKLVFDSSVVVVSTSIPRDARCRRT